MFKSIVVLAAALALATAYDEPAVVPKIFDLGGIKACVPASAYDEDCVTCAVAGKDGEISPTGICLQKCAENGFSIKQLNMTTIAGDDDAAEPVMYWNIKLEPNVVCDEGCGCPVAYGYAVFEENTQPLEYTLNFVGADGSTSTEYEEGVLTINNEEDAVNPISIEVKYNEAVLDDEGNERMARGECQKLFTLESGEISGIPAASGEPTVVPSIPSGEFQGALKRLGATEEACSAFEMDTEDWCTFSCAAEYSVGTKNNTMMLVPMVGFVNHDCKCPWGVGYQIGMGEEFSTAQISFNATKDICTAGYDGKVVHAIGSNDEFSGSFSMTFDMADKKCTYLYSMSGKVMGITGTGTGAQGDHDPTNLPSKGSVVFAMILTVGVIIGFCTPCLMK